MNKYIKTVSILAVVLVTFAIFYIKNDVITGINPELTVEGMKGDTAIVDNILLTGTIYNDETGFAESFTWNKGKTTYDKELSMMQQLTVGTDSFQLKQYEKDYRSFMRGTVRDETFFYENDDVIAYAATPYSYYDFTVVDFDIKLLNKETQDVTKFTIPIPDSGKYWHVGVNDVYYEDGKMYVTTSNEQNTDDSEHTVVMVNVFDIEEQTLVEQKPVAENKGNERHDGYTILETFVDEAESGVVYILVSNYTYVDEVDDTSDLEFTQEEVEVAKIMKLNVTEQKLTEIDVPDKLFHGNMMLAHDGMLYSYKMAAKKLNLHRLNMNDEKVESLEIPLSYTNGMWSIYGGTLDLKEDVLYFTVDYLEVLEKAPLIAIDLTDFTSVFEGEIVPQMKETSAGTMQVYFEQLRLVD